MTDNRELQKIVGAASRKATNLAFRGKSEAAIAEFKTALALLGDPVFESEFACMLFAGIGEVYFLQKDWPAALSYYANALRSDGGLGDPALHFRMGQIRLELGEFDQAKDELMRAYMGSGDVIFENTDPKYFALIKPVIERT